MLISNENKTSSDQIELNCTQIDSNTLRHSINKKSLKSKKIKVGTNSITFDFNLAAEGKNTN
jgi:hypothetical protein